MKTLRKITNFIPLLAIRFYRRFLSRLLPPACRFHPSCSAYGLEAFQTHSLLKAIWLTCYRVLRCNPFNPGGYDPCPGTKAAEELAAKNHPHEEMDSGSQ